MGIYAGPANAWSNSTNQNRIDASTKVVIQSGLVLNLDAGASTSYPGSGTTWTDLSGNGNTGTLTNGPTYSSANGGSIVFDGTNDYSVTSSNANFLIGTGEFAVEWWEYWTGGTGYSGHIGVFDYPNTTINIWTQGGFFYTFSGDWRSFAVSPISNTWTHYVFTGTSQNIRVYQNGVLVDTKTTNYNWSATTSTSNFAIGGTPGWTYGNYASSMGVSNARFYKNKSLTAAEVSQNFNALRARFGI